MKHRYLRNTFPLRELFHKPILPAWPRFMATSAPAGGSRKGSRGWTPFPKSCSSREPSFPGPTSTETLAFPEPPTPRSAAADTGPGSLTSALTPNILEMLGRQMVRSGDVVFMIDMVDGMAELVPAFAHDIFNGWSPMRWQYRLSIPGPDQIFTFMRASRAAPGGALAQSTWLFRVGNFRPRLHWR